MKIVPLNPLSDAVHELEAVLRKKEKLFHRALNIKLIPHPVMQPGGLLLNDLHEAIGLQEENSKLKEEIREHQETALEVVEIIGPTQSDLRKAVERLEACLNVRPMTMDGLRSEIQETIALIEGCSSDLDGIEITDG